MQFSFIQPAFAFSLLILLELVMAYYGLQRLVGKLDSFASKIEDMYLILIFKQVVTFFSNNDVVEQSLFGSLAGMGDKELLGYLRSKLGEMKQQIRGIGEGIERFENVKRNLSRISSLSSQIKIFIVFILANLALVIFLPNQAQLVDLGLVYGMELVALYYTFLSMILYYKLGKDYSDVLKSIDSLDTSK
ncbi:MAG: hypothetical protein QW239_06320 [Metallosphaera sp.]